MRDFSWKYFAMTGDVDAYLLYKETEGESVLTVHPLKMRRPA